jgi:hypothetical protein
MVITIRFIDPIIMTTIGIDITALMHMDTGIFMEIQDMVMDIILIKKYEIEIPATVRVLSAPTV